MKCCMSSPGPTIILLEALTTLKEGCVSSCPRCHQSSIAMATKKERRVFCKQQRSNFELVRESKEGGREGGYEFEKQLRGGGGIKVRGREKIWSWPGEMNWCT